MNVVEALRRQVMELQPSIEIAPDDRMYGQHDQHYFGVGRSAILMILTALTARLSYANGDVPVRRILDFGAGHGRVARFLRVLFPLVRVDVTDFNRSGVDFCITRLGCQDMGADVPQDTYDLIWVGSVFTHLSADVSANLLGSLKRALHTNGVLVLTTGGRLGYEMLDGFAKGRTAPPYTGYGLSADGAARLIAEYDATGHGYHDYPNQTGYGGALLTPGWMFRTALDAQTIQVLFQEMGWDTHQDVYGFMRVGVDGMFGVGRGPYWV